MNTKQILLAVGGVAVGYFLATKLTKKCTCGGMTNSKEADCQAKLTEQLKLIRPTSEEALNEFKTQFLADCMK
jgi:hypothetical protein